MKHNIITRKGHFFTFLALATASLSSTAQASEVFGQKGGIVLGGKTGATGVLGHQWRGKDSAAASVALVTLQPELGVFVARNVLAKVSLSAQAHWLKSDQHSGAGPLAFGVEPTLGVNLRLGRGVSLLPTLGGTYGLSQGLDGSRTWAHRVGAVAELPLVFQLVQHGALTFGPTAQHLFLPHAATSLGVAGGLLLWI